MSDPFDDDLDNDLDDEFNALDALDALDDDLIPGDGASDAVTIDERTLAHVLADDIGLDEDNDDLDVFGLDDGF